MSLVLLLEKSTVKVRLRHFLGFTLFKLIKKVDSTYHPSHPRKKKNKIKIKEGMLGILYSYQQTKQIFKGVFLNSIGL